jgi:hypothetical protein
MAEIILAKEKKDAVTAIRSAEATLRDAVTKLRSIPELDVPTALGNIVDADWLREQLGNRIALVRADKSLTAAERESRLAPWRAIKAKSERAVLKIDGILHDCPELDWLPDQDGLNYHLADEQVDAIAQQKSTRTVPPLAEEHWRLIAEMRSAVEALRSFEQQHQVKDCPLVMLSRMSENQLYESWINRSMLLSSRTIGGKVIAPQKVKELYY